MKIYRLALLSFASIFAFVSCGGGSSEKKDFTGIVFNNTQVDYDGNAHTIAPTGVPDFAHLEYIGESQFTDIGKHPISIKVIADGYNDYAKTATLTIGKEFSGIEFKDDIVPYDGDEHTIKATGCPDFAEVNYFYPRGEGPFTDVGDYPIGVKITAEGYIPYQDIVTLYITKANYPTDIVFNDKTFEYDGKPHSLVVSGNTPGDTTITYTREGYFKDGNIATDVGVYLVTAHLKNPNYVDKDLTATLTIESHEIERNIRWSGNTLYFQNAKDHNRLYALKDDPNGIVKVSNDNAVDIVPTGNSGDEVAYIDNSKLLPAIKYAKYNDGAFETQNELSRACRYLQTDGACYYYAVNSQIEGQSGIYKLSQTENGLEETRLYKGEAYFLQIVNDNIYFACGVDQILSYIDKYDVDQTATHIQNSGKDVIIKNLSYLNGALYYTGEDGIYQYTISSSSFNKIANTVGVDFSLVNDDLYYVAVNNSLIYGSAIRKINITSKVDSQVITTTSATISSLTSDGTYLYYYDADKLIRCSLDGSEDTDLLAEFSPTPTHVTNRLGQVSMHNDIAYYLNAYDDDTLHSYDIASKRDTRLTSNKVSGYSFVGDTLYVNSIEHSPNDIVTYTLDINTGAATLFNNVYSREVVTDGTYLYYAKGYPATSIYQCALDGSNAKKIYSDGTNVRNLRVANNKLYFISGTLYSIDLNAISGGAKTILPPNVIVICFDTSSEYIYYAGATNENAVSRSLVRCKLDGTERTTIVDNTDLVSMKYYENSEGVDLVYYYNYGKDDSLGLFYVSVDGPTYIPTKLTQLDAYYARAFDVNNNGICFSDYSDSHGDMHTYYSDFSIGQNPIQIDW